MWRIIPVKEFSAAINMALDEAIMERVREGADPTIRFYTWNPSAISIGYFQGYDNEVNDQACIVDNVDVVRRSTGGGAVYHDIDGEITYSLIAPETLYPKEIIKSYEAICNHIVEALASLGINAHFQPINDIITNEQKISGNAQTRRGGVLLQHGTILYKVDVEKMFSVLKVPDEKIKDKLIKSVMKRVTSVVLQNPNVTKEQLAKALIDSFSKGKEWKLGDYLPEEIARAEIIAHRKYASKSWTRLR
ncbi:MAG: biotin/lipoate A/B protein ligase family protein [Candidatus Woesearchaeota archaeon]